MISADSSAPPAESARQSLMRLSALATEAELRSAIETLGPLPQVADLRPAEAGLVMVRGKAGGSGMPFNFGEATVSRATVALSSGQIGFGYTLGRSLQKARLAAVVDALGQTEAFGPRIRAALDERTLARVGAERTARSTEVAATKVDFFTMQRGED